MLTIPAGSFSRDGTITNVSVITRPYRISAYDIPRTQFVSWYRAIAFCNRLSLAEGLEPVYAVDGVDFITLTFGQIPGSSNDAWTNATATWTNDGYRLPTEMEWM